MTSNAKTAEIARNNAISAVTVLERKVMLMAKVFQERPIQPFKIENTSKGIRKELARLQLVAMDIYTLEKDE